MTSQDVIQLILFFALLIGLTPVLGNYMSKVFYRKQTFHDSLFLVGSKSLTYKFIGVNP